MQNVIPAPITPPSTKLQNYNNNNNNNNSSISIVSTETSTTTSSFINYNTPSPTSSHQQQQLELQNVAAKVGADFFVPRCFSLNKGRWLNHLKLQQPLRVSRSLVCFRVVGFCSV
jgi:hypothetical protein